MKHAMKYLGIFLCLLAGSAIPQSNPTINSGYVLGNYSGSPARASPQNALLISSCANSLAVLYFPTTTSLACSASLTAGLVMVGSASGPVPFGSAVQPNATASNTAFGINAEANPGSATNASAFGNAAGNYQQGIGPTAFGSTACQGTGAAADTGNYNSCFGDGAGVLFQGAAAENTALGAFSCGSATTGTFLVCIGYAVGNSGMATNTDVVMIGTSINCVPVSTSSFHEWDLCGNSTNWLRVTGTNTPSTSAATFAGTLNATGGTQSYGAPTTLSIPTGTATFAVGTNVTSVVCASGYSCNNSRGTLTIVGGTATTGTIATVSFSAALSAAPACFAFMNGGATAFGIGNGAPSTTAFTITAAVSVASATFNVNYECRP